MPVHHVRADGVAPVHVAPDGCTRIELIEEVVLSLPTDWAVGVVHPVVRWKEMISGAERIVSDVGNLT
jgi:hypothetical protein